MLTRTRRVLRCDVPTCSPRELLRRAVAIDFDPSTPVPTRLAVPHPGRTRAMRDRVGAGVLRSGRTWVVLDPDRDALDRVLDRLFDKEMT